MPSRAAHPRTLHDLRPARSAHKTHSAPSRPAYLVLPLGVAHGVPKKWLFAKLFAFHFFCHQTITEWTFARFQFQFQFNLL